MLKFFNISCERANEICNKAQYSEATFIEKLQLNWHILFCKFCALYSKQNRTLTNMCKSKANNCKAETFTMSDKDKELLKEEFKKIHL